MGTRLLELEDRYHLLQDDIKGFRYWAYIRMHIDERISEILGEQEKGTIASKSSVKNWIELVINCTIHNCMFHLKKKELLILTHPRRLMENGFYQCIYTEQLSDLYNDLCITGEFVFHNRHLKPIKDKNIVYLDWIDVYPAINYKWKKLFKNKIKKICYQKSKKICDILRKELGIVMDEEEMENDIYKKYLYYISKKKLLEKVIKKCMPKIIVEVVGYETNKMIINEIASKYSICTIELQHGVIGKGHLAYNYQSKERLNYMPEKMFFFSDYWKQTCHFPLGNKNLIVTGYPYLDSQKKKYPKCKSKKILTIIVISEHIYSKELLLFVLEVIELFRKKEIEVKIIYKLHPAEFQMPKEIWSDLKIYPEIKLIDQADISLYSLLSKADIQFGVHSTALFEGLSYGLVTYIYHLPKTDDYMGGLVEKGYAKFVKTPIDMVEEIENQEYKQETSEDNQFFKSNALSNMQNEINYILNNK